MSLMECQCFVFSIFHLKTTILCALCGGKICSWTLLYSQLLWYLGVYPSSRASHSKMCSDVPVILYILGGDIYGSLFYFSTILLGITSINGMLVFQWCKLYEHSYVQVQLLSPILRYVLNEKSSFREGVILVFHLLNRKFHQI